METISTLRYAGRAKSIQNRTHINEEPKDALLRHLQEEIADLKKQLEEGAAEGASGEDYDEDEENDNDTNDDLDEEEENSKEKDKNEKDKRKKQTKAMNDEKVRVEVEIIPGVSHQQFLFVLGNREDRRRKGIAGEKGG